MRVVLAGSAGIGLCRVIGGLAFTVGGLPGAAIALLAGGIAIVIAGITVDAALRRWTDPWSEGRSRPGRCGLCGAHTVVLGDVRLCLFCDGRATEEQRSVGGGRAGV
ncbi:MAG: hypothetical protein R3290_11730 [Acidimicrobiia bacterium]|nr:hypothetical protein [Acidimicrobiia bacterium]